MTLKMWPLKCVRFIVLVWVSSRAGFRYKNARENPRTKLQFSFVAFKGTSNLSLFRETGTWRLMDRYKIFMWLQAVYCNPAHYILNYPLSSIPACYKKWMSKGSELRFYWEAVVNCCWDRSYHKSQCSLHLNKKDVREDLYFRKDVPEPFCPPHCSCGATCWFCCYA